MCRLGRGAVPLPIVVAIGCVLVGLYMGWIWLDHAGMLDQLDLGSWILNLESWMLLDIR